MIKALKQNLSGMNDYSLVAFSPGWIAMAESNPEAMGNETFHIVIEGVPDRPWRGDSFKVWYVYVRWIAHFLSSFPGAII